MPPNHVALPVYDPGPREKRSFGQGKRRMNGVSGLGRSHVDRLVQHRCSSTSLRHSSRWARSSFSCRPYPRRLPQASEGSIVWPLASTQVRWNERWRRQVGAERGIRFAQARDDPGRSRGQGDRNGRGSSDGESKERAPVRQRRAIRQAVAREERERASDRHQCGSDHELREPEARRLTQPVEAAVLRTGAR